MLIQKAFKYRLVTNPEQEELLRQHAGSCRYIWNKALELQKYLLHIGERKLGYADLCKEITAWKKMPRTEFLKEAPSQVLQQSMKDMDRAYSNYFSKRAKAPVPKKRGKHDSFRVPAGFEIDQKNSVIRIPKLGWFRYCNSREITGKAKNITVSLNAGHWYASVQTEQEVAEPVHQSTKQIGGDRGVNSFLALSDGSLIQPLNAFKTTSRKLARLQRQLSRKVKFSENWKKAKQKITRLHSKIANMRKDYLHKLSTIVAKSHGVVVLEDLKIANMSKSASGSIETPGRKVKQKAGLNRAILDQGWYEFGRQLEYKLKWLGGTFIKVPAQYTSQKCSCCGHTEAQNRKAQKFVCLSCGTELHADINAAKNILAAGLAVIACGEHLAVRGSMKQEPLRGSYGSA